MFLERQRWVLVQRWHSLYGVRVGVWTALWDRELAVGDLGGWLFP